MSDGQRIKVVLGNGPAMVLLEVEKLPVVGEEFTILGFEFVSGNRDLVGRKVNIIRQNEDLQDPDPDSDLTVPQFDYETI
jgi:hypothetical protein